MGMFKDLLIGFLCMLFFTTIYVIAPFFAFGNTWLEMIFLASAIFPFLTAILLISKENGSNSEDIGSFNKWRRGLLLFQGAALACWSFDIISTFYAINIAGVATEINPLGWPAGILGAMAFYAPAITLTYYLTSRHYHVFTFSVATINTGVIILMGTRNLGAGLQNIAFFTNTAFFSPNVKFSLLSLVTLADLLSLIILAKRLPRNLFLNTKTPGKTL